MERERVSHRGSMQTAFAFHTQHKRLHVLTKATTLIVVFRWWVALFRNDKKYKRREASEWSEPCKGKETVNPQAPALGLLETFGEVMNYDHVEIAFSSYVIESKIMKKKTSTLLNWLHVTLTSESDLPSELCCDQTQCLDLLMLLFSDPIRLKVLLTQSCPLCWK